MDIQENNTPGAEHEKQTPQPIPQAPQPPQPAPVKPSPFANSPYVQASAPIPPQNRPPMPQNQPPYAPPRPMPQNQAPYAPPRPMPQNQPPYAAPQPRPMPQNQPINPPAPAPKPEKKGGIRPWQVVIAAVAVVLLVIVACGITYSMINSYWSGQYQNLSKSVDERLNVVREEMDEIARPGASDGNSLSGTPNVNPDGGLTPGQVYAQNVESVVAINCTTTGTQYGQAVQSTSSGSGFIMTEDGYIATNYHVVESATKRVVVMSDGTEYEATYIGGDEANDIAILKIEAEGLRAVTIGKSDNLIVGDQVAAIGNPLGELASTLTVGYVSAKDRIVTTDGTQINMLQTDAAINPGNSGGPLFNMNGEVVGITTAKYSGTTESGASIEGIGFAIPMDDILGMLEDLMEYGYITGGYLGVTVSDVDLEASKQYGLPLGALVHDVTAGSCAEDAGLKKQDIIINLGGYQVENLNDLSRALRKFDAGDEISVTVYRNGQEVYLSVVLDEKPVASQSTTDTTEPTTGSAEDWYDHFYG